MNRFYKVTFAVLVFVAIVQAIWIRRLLQQSDPAHERVVIEEVRGASIPAVHEIVSASPGKPPLPSLTSEQRQPVPVQVPRLLDRSGSISDEFARQFGITDIERMQLNDAVDQARGRIDSLVSANATVTPLPNGRVLVDVRPFVEQGRAVYDDLLASITGVLGGEKGGEVIGNGGDQIERAFGHFGAVSREIMVGRTPNPDGSISLDVSDGYQFGDGARGHSMQGFSSFDQFAQRYKGIADLLPADVDWGKKKK